MSILVRLRRIARANIDWLVGAEETYRSADRFARKNLLARAGGLWEAVGECKPASGRFGAAARRLQRQADELAGRQAELQRQAEQRLADGDEPSARRLLLRRIVLTCRLNAAGPRLDRAVEACVRAGERLNWLGEQFAAVRAALAELGERPDEAQGRAAVRALSERLNRIESAIQDEPAVDEAEQAGLLEAEALLSADGPDAGADAADLGPLVKAAVVAIRAAPPGPGPVGPKPAAGAAPGRGGRTDAPAASSPTAPSGAKRQDHD